jgi:hypothetical protein
MMMTQHTGRGLLRHLLIFSSVLLGLAGLIGWAGTATPTKAGGALAPLTPFPTATCPPEGWSYSSHYPIPIRDHAVAALGSRLYGFGGYREDAPVGPIATAYRFSLTGGWSSVIPMPQPRIYHAVAADGNRIYIEGGRDTTTRATLWAYNPNLGAYQILAPAPRATTFHALVHLNGKLYRIGGSLSDGTETNTVDVYDIGVNTWSTVAPYPAAARRILAVAYNGYNYAGGGDNGIYIAKTYRYNPATNVWDDAAVRDFPSGRTAAATAVLNGHWLVTGGGGGTVSTSTIALDLSHPTDPWDYRASLPAATWGWAGATLGQLFYGFGGEVSSEPTWNMLRYSDGCP